MKNKMNKILNSPQPICDVLPPLFAKRGGNPEYSGFGVSQKMKLN